MYFLLDLSQVQYVEILLTFPEFGIASHAQKKIQRSWKKKIAQENCWVGLIENIFLRQNLNSMHSLGGT